MSALRAGAVLARAADRIERDGWHQGGYYTGWNPDLDVLEWGWRGVNEALNREPRPCCAIGAVMAEASSPSDFYDAEHALNGFLGSIGEVEYAADFNDVDTRTKEEVVAALRKAAKECGWQGGAS